jgi:hypothetical protein
MAALNWQDSRESYTGATMHSNIVRLHHVQHELILTRRCISFMGTVRW